MNMSTPRIRIRSSFEKPSEQICELGEAKQIFTRYRIPVLVFAEEQLISSYEELVDIAQKEIYRDKEFIDVTLYLAPTGGG